MPAADATESDKIIEFFEEMAKAETGVRWAVIVRKESEFAGAVGFNCLAPSAELAFHLRPEYWGRGIMREAAQAALAWLRNRSDVPVEAFIEPENLASIALARRLGFEPAGDRKDGAVRFSLGR